MRAPIRLRAWPAGARVTGTQRLLLLSVTIGIFTGLLIVCFHVTIDLISWATLGTPVGRDRAATMLAPAFGGGLAGLLVLFVFPSARGSGLNQTKAALYISNGHIPFRTVVAKFVTCSTSIGMGNSLGPEDPALQMGAGVASLLGRSFKVARHHLRLVAPVGAAAGIAAAFNTPITAVLFVIEEVIGSWNATVLGSIVLSAVSAVVVSRWFLGSEPLFRVPAFALTHPSELVVYAAIGLAAGLLGTLFVLALGALRERLSSAGLRSRALYPFLAGLFVGLVGLAVPQVLGVGYGAVDSALHDEFLWPVLLTLALAKMAVTVACFAAGTPGGMFAPTLFIGAMLGGGAGMLAQIYWPAPTSPASAYVLVGMGTFFAAVFRAPMTSVFMVFEVSASYVIILPVMIANLVAYLVARQLHHVTFFEMAATQDGLVLPSSDALRDTPVLRVEDAMVEVADASILDADGRSLPRVYPDQSLDTVLRKFGRKSSLPVVSRENASRVLGVIRLEDVLRAYGVDRADAAPGATDAGPPA